MAMTMEEQVSLPAPREVVWDMLNDPEVLRICIPGCKELDVQEDGGFTAAVKLKVGPISATFKGRVRLSDIDPPNGYKISGEGEGGMAGFAKGGAVVALDDIDERSCMLKYKVDAEVGGKMAQLGSRLIDSVAKKTADQFFSNFAKYLEEQTESSGEVSVG